jgi:hypothetical protein
MRTLNRSAFVVRPKEPYLQWAAGIDADSAEAAEVLRGQASVYLVPRDPLDREETAPLADYFSEIFRIELEAWSLDEGQWPATRDLETFRRWFDVVGESIVVDLAGGRLRIEEL